MLETVPPVLIDRLFSQSPGSIQTIPPIVIAGKFETVPPVGVLS